MKSLPSLDGHKDYVSCLIVWDNFLASGSHDRTIKVRGFEEISQKISFGI